MLEKEKKWWGKVQMVVFWKRKSKREKKTLSLVCCPRPNDMQTLQEQGIYVDFLRRRMKAYQPPAKVCFLTHAHSDHIDARGGCDFLFPIVCLAWTAQFLKCKAAIRVVPGKRYVWDDWEFEVFETHHCPGAMGIYFPTWNIVYVGDARIHSTLLKRLLHWNCQIALVDGSFASWPGPCPTLHRVRRLFRQYLQQQSKSSRELKVVVPHLSSLLLWKGLKCRLDPSLDPGVRRGLMQCGLVDPQSHWIAVGRDYPEPDFYPSLLWFWLRPQLDREKLHVDKKGCTRVCASFHCDGSEVDGWMQSQPRLTIEFTSPPVVVK